MSSEQIGTVLLTIVSVVAIVFSLIAFIDLVISSKYDKADFERRKLERDNETNLDNYCRVNRIYNESDKISIANNNCPLVHPDCKGVLDYSECTENKCRICRTWWTERIPHASNT